jgi:hypothetical protein
LAGTINQVHYHPAPPPEERSDGLIKLDTGQVGGGVVSGKQVNHHQVDRARETSRKPTDNIPGVAVSNPNTPAGIKRRMGSHQVNEVFLPFDDLLP